MDSSYSLMHNDLSDFGSLILMHITPEERILKFNKQLSVVVMTGLDSNYLVQCVVLLMKQYHSVVL